MCGKGSGGLKFGLNPNPHGGSFFNSVGDFVKERIALGIVTSVNMNSKADSGSLMLRGWELPHHLWAAGAEVLRGEQGYASRWDAARWSGLSFPPKGPVKFRA